VLLLAVRVEGHIGAELECEATLLLKVHRHTKLYLLKSQLQLGVLQQIPLLLVLNAHLT